MRGDAELYNLGREDILYVETNSALLEGFSSVADLKSEYEKSIAARHKEFMATKKSAEVSEGTEERFHYLDNLVSRALAYIRYNRIRRQLQRSRYELTGASVVAAVALMGFAWAANPEIEKPEFGKPAIVLQAPASQALLTLTDTGKKALASVIGVNCVTIDLIPVIILNITTDGYELVTLKTKDCALARFTLSDSLGKLSNVSP